MPKEGQAAPAPEDGGGPGKWSEEPIDLSGLKAANAVVNFSVESLLVQKIKIGASALKAVLKNGVLNLNLSKMVLYGGSRTGTVKLDASKKTPRVSKLFVLAGIEAHPLLTDAAGFSELKGKGELKITVNAVGVSQKAMVSSASGSGGFVFRNGSVKGFNLGGMARKVESAFLDASTSKQQQTDFSELKGTFKIKKGVVTNNDLFMASPLLRVTGKGQTSLPARTVNYRMEPKAVALSVGQGRKTDIAGVTVPVIIKGSWYNLSYQPDLAGAVKDLLKNPGKVVDTAKNVAKQAKDLVKDPGKTIKDLKQPGNAGGGGVDDAVKGLKSLFGK